MNEEQTNQDTEERTSHKDQAIGIAAEIKGWGVDVRVLPADLLQGNVPLVVHVGEIEHQCKTWGHVAYYLAGVLNGLSITPEP